MSDPASREDSPRNHFGGRGADRGRHHGVDRGGLYRLPAILVASLTLIDKQEDPEHVSYDAVGAALGAVGFVACALFISLTLERWPVAASLGVGLYALYALLASRGREDEG